MKLEEINLKIKSIKRESKEGTFSEENAKADPFEQFLDWFDESISLGKCDPTAMVLATSDANGQPDTRVVLLKELEHNRFIFYSNYRSKKASDLANNNIAAINFYWPTFNRQIRIKGHVVKIDREKSQAYFATRPRETQLGAHAWIQSCLLSNRDEIHERIESQTKIFSGKEVTCPEVWGGYALTPFEYEFFQGRKWRFNDRIKYVIDNNIWKLTRLAP